MTRQAKRLTTQQIIKKATRSDIPPVKTCEICNDRRGNINSMFYLDDEYEGLWVCMPCEQEAEDEFHTEIVRQQMEMTPDTQSQETQP